MSNKNVKLELGKDLTEHILRKLKYKNLTEYLTKKLQEDLLKF